MNIVPIMPILFAGATRAALNSTMPKSGRGTRKSERKIRDAKNKSAKASRKRNRK